MTLAYFIFEGFLTFLIWLALAVMSFWIWKSSKAKASLVTLVGSALLALVSFLVSVANSFGLMILEVFGAALVALGYYLTVKPTVDARIHALKAQAKAGPGPSSAPPAPPAP